MITNPVNSVTRCASQENNQRLSKTRLAEALWPALAGKVDAAVAGFAPVPPIVQVVSDAHGMAVEARMKHYVIGRLA